jgi:hypothetical protein
MQYSVLRRLSKEAKPLFGINRAIGRISGMIMVVTARRSHGEYTDLVVEHELPGVTPEMLDWWWDNIEDTERYKLWHPDSHQVFEWEHDCEEHVGKVQVVREKVGLFPITLRIRWEDPDDAPIPRVYSHANLGSILDGRDRPLSWLLHQYEAMPAGTGMRSTFRLPSKTPAWFIKALKKHNREEMAQFSVFLPALFEECERSTRSPL